MDFETLFLKDGVRPPNEYKFDPMDFETQVLIVLDEAHNCINLILWILKRRDSSTRK